MLKKDDFTATYNPSEQMSLDEAEAMLKEKGFDKTHLWTVTEGEQNSEFASPGYHVVDRLGYLVTEKPWDETVTGAIWWEPEATLIASTDEKGSTVLHFNPDRRSNSAVFVLDDEAVDQLNESNDLTGMEFIAIKLEPAPGKPQGHFQLHVATPDETRNYNVSDGPVVEYDGENVRIAGENYDSSIMFGNDDEMEVYYLGPTDMSGTIGYKGTYIPFRKTGNTLSIGIVSMTFTPRDSLSPR